MVFSATFNNISDISWRSVLLVEEIRVPGEIHRPVPLFTIRFTHGVGQPITFNSKVLRMVIYSILVDS
jgi:hypothetical protein